jgi:glucose-6-phosphate dehydrogenase assembly protein OpcA
MSSRGGGPLLTVPPGPPTSAILARLERQIRELWVGLPGELPKSRVCMMNLVVAVPSRAIADRYMPVLDEVAASLPSCAILVALESSAPTRPLDGSAIAVRAPGAGGAVCSERIRLDACGSVCARVASAVEALIAPEVLTTLVWLGPVRAGDEVFTSMAGSVQRVILDSEYTSVASLLEVARWSREAKERPAFADMAWTRIASWQDLCARFFDDPRTEHAGAVTRVTIQQTSEAGAPLGSEGALLLGWLASRLGWRADRTGGALHVRRADGQDVQVQVGTVLRRAGVAPLALASLTVESSTGGVALKGTIERADSDVLTWRLDVSGQATIEQRIRLRADRGARVLERTLHRPVVDPVLVEAVQFAEGFLGSDA